MKSPRSSPREERLGALIIVLLVLAILATLLPGGSRAAPAPRGPAGSFPPALRAPAGTAACGRVTHRAPAHLEAADRGYEGRIVRIPPRPGRDPQARVPGPSVHTTGPRAPRFERGPSPAGFRPVPRGCGSRVGMPGFRRRI
jgi:hypothetical protein